MIAPDFRSDDEKVTDNILVSLDHIILRLEALEEHASFKPRPGTIMLNLEMLRDAFEKCGLSHLRHEVEKQLFGSPEKTT